MLNINSPDASVQGGRARQRLGVQPAPAVTLLLQLLAGELLARPQHAPVPVEGAVVGRGLGRGVDGAGALVDGGAHAAHAAHPHAPAPPAPVYRGQRHVGVLVLNLTQSQFRNSVVDGRKDEP